jgi:cytochrome c-type biogenesis protein CcmH/NrfF
MTGRGVRVRFSARAGLRIALLGALALLSFAASSAHGATPRADFTDVEDEVMCDTCNVPLYIAESPRADQLRTEIRDLIAAGLTKAQIKDRLKAEYGPNILAEPDKSGLGVLAYVLPVALALALVALLAVLLPRWRRRRPPDGPGDSGEAGRTPESDADRRRLDDELARYGA